MTKKKKEPFLPFVTLEDIFAFDPTREETFTKSPLMNAVLTAVKRERLTTQIEVANYMAVNTAHLGGAVKIITGMSFNQMRDLLLRHIVGLIVKEHPDWEKKQIAEAIGYSDHSSLWRLFHREYDHNYNKEMHEHLTKYLAEMERQYLMSQWQKQHETGEKVEKEK